MVSKAKVINRNESDFDYFLVRHIIVIFKETKISIQKTELQEVAQGRIKGS